MKANQPNWRAFSEKLTMNNVSEKARELLRPHRFGCFMGQMKVLRFAAVHVSRPLEVPYMSIAKDHQDMMVQLQEQNFSLAEQQKFTDGYFFAIENTLRAYRQIESEEARKLEEISTIETYQGLVLPEGHDVCAPTW